MKILLIQAPLGRQNKPVYPLGLAYLAEALSKEHRVLITDANLKTWPQIHRTIKQFQPNVIGLGLKNIDTAQSYDPYSYFQHFPPFVAAIRNAAPRSVLVVGGTGFSLFPRVVMKICTEIDFGVELEGEESFPLLLRRLHEPESVPGIYYREDEEILFSGPSRLPDFAASPPPLRLLDPNPYQQHRDQFGVQSKRGCVHHCLYCNYPHLNGGSIRARDPDSVVKELARLKKDHGIRHFFFADALFNEPREHSEAIMEKMIRRNLHLKWAAYFSMRNFDYTFLDLAKKAGCELFEFSPDCLRQNTLNALQKGISEEQIRNVMALFEGVDFPRFTLCFMFNTPSSSVQDFLLLWRVVRNWPHKYPALQDVTLSNMRIYPNTPLHELSIEKGLITSKNDLIRPIFYDPRPLNLFSKLVNNRDLYRFWGN